MKSILFLIFMILLVSCESLFKEDADDYLKIDTEQEKLDILNGIYAQLAVVYDDDFFETLARSDDINLYPNANFSPEDFPYGCIGGGVHNSSKPYYVPRYENIYHPFYKIILSANSVIPQLSSDKDAHIKGELYFLRAYAYFMLARFFGTPHIVTDIDVNYTLERPSYTEVYQFIEEDLLMALELLPNTFTDARIPEETPHKGTAQAMLAEVYLSWAGYPILDEDKYAKAMKFASNVIGRKEFYGLDLLEDYGSNWGAGIRYSPESIFALFYSTDSDETMNRIAGAHSANINMDNRIMSGEYMPEFKFYDEFPESHRKNCSLIKYDFYEFKPLLDPCGYIARMITMKWIDSTGLFELPWWDNDCEIERTLHLLRYAQTLLTFSEARARSGIIDDSTFEAVNMIRRRANRLDPYSPSEFDLPRTLSVKELLDSIVWERAWELNFEPNGRWFDIIRLDLKDKLPEYRYDHDIPYFIREQYLQDNWYFYKIPE